MYRIKNRPYLPFCNKKYCLLFSSFLFTYETSAHNFVVLLAKSHFQCLPEYSLAKITISSFSIGLIMLATLPKKGCPRTHTVMNLMLPYKYIVIRTNNWIMLKTIQYNGEYIPSVLQNLPLEVHLTCDSRLESRENTIITGATGKFYQEIYLLWENQRIQRQLKYFHTFIYFLKFIKKSFS